MSVAARKATGVIETRFAGGPQSYDRDARAVDAVLSKGSPVKRDYGTEVLRIAPGAVVLDRLADGGIPVLDSHNQFGINNALGRVQKAWFDKGALMGRLTFNDTDEGRKAEGMVARGEISGVSAGYRVNQWEVRDGDGDVVDPNRLRWDDQDNDLTFTATNWELLEVSLVTIPADAKSLIRSYAGRDIALPPGSGSDRKLVRKVRARMRIRQRMLNRHMAFVHSNR
jgi:phage head maturation protease